MDIPQTAVEALAMLVLLVGTWVGSGELGSLITDLVKRLPGVAEGDASRLAGTGAQFAAAVITTAVGLAALYLGPAAQFLDTSSLWTLLVAALPALKFAYEAHSRKKRVTLVEE